MTRHARCVIICALVLGSLPVGAQDPSPFGRLVNREYEPGGAGRTGVVKNLGFGTMWSVVIQANTCVEDRPAARADYGTTKIVTQDLGTREATQATVTWSADQPGREENMVHIATTR